MMLKDEEKIKQLNEKINSSSRIVFFTGAGISTASGIPDFRSKDGLYNQKYTYPPEEILSKGFFFFNVETFYKFYKEKMLVLDKKPNVAHNYITKLSEKKDCSVITQNIDGLHTLAKNKNVIELHGSIYRNYCMDCHAFFTAQYIKDSKEIVPHCDGCNGVIKPDVVLYDECLDEMNINRAIVKVTEADLLIVIGTSLTVYPANTFLSYLRKGEMVIINRDATAYDKYASIIIRDDIKEVFTLLDKML